MKLTLAWLKKAKFRMTLMVYSLEMDQILCIFLLTEDTFGLMVMVIFMALGSKMVEHTFVIDKLYQINMLTKKLSVDKLILDSVSCTLYLGYSLLYFWTSKNRLGIFLSTQSINKWLHKLQLLIMQSALMLYLK